LEFHDSGIAEAGNLDDGLMQFPLAEE